MPIYNIGTMERSKRAKRLSPIQTLVLGYLLVTTIGALILSLPVSSASGTRQSFFDALFVAASGISTTGLTMVDIGSYYSRFGQIVLMCIFQIGGIGYMTFFMFIAYFLGIRPSFTTHVVAKESLATNSYHMLGRFFVNVLLYTILIEFMGALVLTLFWMREFSVSDSIYFGIFHSVAAFCTAGFSTFSNNLIDCRSSLIVNSTINIVSLLGAIGFFVLLDLYNYGYRKSKRLVPARLTLHSKMALLVTGIVVLAGAVIIFISEKWSGGIPFSEKILTSFFQSISASTTDGFNTLDIGAMSGTSLTILMFLMFVGASPGSTGGGMKTTALGTIFLSIKSFLRGNTRVNVFQRELPQKTTTKAFALFGLFVLIVLIDVLILSNSEKVSYVQIMFETISALGNTGLSMGITANLTLIGKLILTITMFIGRVGPLTIGAAMFAQEKKALIKFLPGEIFIG